MSPDITFVPDPNWPTIVELAIEVWGQPNKALSSRDDVRFGDKGSKSVKPSAFVWKDHETGDGGGYFEMWRLARRDAPLPSRETSRPKPGIGLGGKVPPWENIGSTYPYRNADGDLVLEVVRTRTGTPRFVQRAPDGFRDNGEPKWKWSVTHIPGHDRLLYRLPGLRASGDATVWITEGEKDADRLHDEGLIAITGIGGAGKWRDEYAEEFRGKPVVILEDNDQAGRDHAAAVARSLIGTAASVKVLALPGLPEKGDVSDWLDAGGTVDDLEQLGREAQEYRLPAPDPAEHELPQIAWIDERLSDWAERDLPTRLWVVEDWILRAQVTGMYGVGGINKTDLLIMLLLAKSKGLPFLGYMLEPGPVYGLFCEDTREEIIRRATRIIAHWGFKSLADFADFHFASLVGVTSKEFVTFDNSKMTATDALVHFDRMITEIGAHLAVLDTLPHFYGGNEIARRDVTRFITQLDAISIARRCGILFAAHPSQRGKQSGSLDSGSTGWEGGVRARLTLHDPGPEAGNEDEAAPQIDSNRRILTRAKANYAKAGEILELVVRDGVFLLTSVGPEAASQPPKSGPMRNEMCDAKFLELLAAVAAQGSYVNESVHSGRYAPKEFAQRPGHGGFRQVEFTRAMRRLFEAKRIKVIDFGPPSRAWRKIIDVQAEPDQEPDEATHEPPTPLPPPTQAEIAAAIDDHIQLDDGERALQRIATAERLGGMKLKVFDGLVTAARKRTAPAYSGFRSGSGRLPAEQDPAGTPEIVPGDDKSS